MAEDPAARPPGAPRVGSDGTTSSNSTSSTTDGRIESATDLRSGLVKRAIGMTADRLGRSKSLGKAQLSQSQPTLPTQPPKRLLSISNRGKGKEKALSSDWTGHEGERGV